MNRVSPHHVCGSHETGRGSLAPSGLPVLHGEDDPEGPSGPCVQQVGKWAGALPASAGQGTPALRGDCVRGKHVLK